MKKSWLFGLISLLLIPAALADVGSTLSGVWWKILSIGNLSFLGLSDGSIVAAMVRILIWILMFTVFFAVMTAFGGSSDRALGFLNRGQSIVIAAVIATIGAVFLPPQILLATGAGWATAIALILIGGPVVGVAFLLWKIPWEGDETRGTLLLKLVLCLLLFWILSVMKVHVAGMV